MNNSLNSTDPNRLRNAADSASKYAEDMFFKFIADSTIECDVYEDPQLEELKANYVRGKTSEHENVKEKWERIKQENIYEKKKNKVLKAIRVIKNNSDILEDIGWEIEINRIEEDDDEES